MVWEKVTWKCPICKRNFDLEGYNKGLVGKRRHLRAVHGTTLTEVNGGQSEVMKKIHAAKRARQERHKAGDANALAAIARLQQLQRSGLQHQLVNVRRERLGGFRSTWFCAKCLAQGTTSSFADIPCRPVEERMGSKQVARWWQGLTLDQKLRAEKAAGHEKGWAASITTMAAATIEEKGSDKRRRAGTKAMLERRAAKSKEERTAKRKALGLPECPAKAGGTANQRQQVGGVREARGLIEGAEDRRKGNQWWKGRIKEEEAEQPNKRKCSSGREGSGGKRKRAC